MTAVADAPQADIEGVASPQAVVVGVMAGEGVQIGVLLDANAPVSVMTDPLLKVVNSRLRELGEAPLEATGRGRWALCLVDGAPLRATQSLTEQDVYDGDRLWIRSSQTPNVAPKSSNISPPQSPRISASGSPGSTRSLLCRSGRRWWRPGLFLPPGCSAGGAGITTPG